MLFNSLTASGLSRAQKAIVIIGGIMLGLILTYVTLGEANVALADAAARLVDTCGEATTKMECYEREVPKLFTKYTVAQLFEIIRLVRSTDAEYQFCHVLAHKIGEYVVAEDPEKWIEAMPHNPSDGMCSNGFIHGVIGGRFRAEVLERDAIEKLIPDFRRACEATKKWKPSPLDQAICYHGMGHLYVYITDADLRASLDVCERTADPTRPESDYRQVCREGVFMQIYQPLEPDDFEMLKRMEEVPTKETVRKFCADFREVPEYEGACLRESWPLFRDEVITGTGVKNFCAGQPNSTEEKNCYQAATAIIGRMSLSDFGKATSACEALVESWRVLCFTTVATSIIEENRREAKKALNFCMQAKEPVASECLKTLASRARWFFGTDARQHQQFCSVFPAEYHSVCIR